MLAKKYFKSILSLTALSMLIGCSNSSSPVSVSGNDPAITAAINSKRLSDVAAAGLNNLWGISFDDADAVHPPKSDFYIYKYNPSNGAWNNTYHYGKCLAVTSTGKCYHVNDDNQIWWGDGNGGVGNLSNGTDIAIIQDIGAANAFGYDWVWICGYGNNGYKVWRASINSDGVADWKNATITQFTPSKIYCDPYNGYRAIAVARTTGQVFVTLDSGISWTLQSMAGVCDGAAMCGNFIIVKRPYSPSATWKGVINQTTDYSLVTAGGYNSLAADMDGSTYYYYYLTWTGLTLVRGTF